MSDMLEISYLLYDPDPKPVLSVFIDRNARSCTALARAIGDERRPQVDASNIILWKVCSHDLCCILTTLTASTAQRASSQGGRGRAKGMGYPDGQIEGAAEAGPRCHCDTAGYDKDGFLWERGPSRTGGYYRAAQYAL